MTCSLELVARPVPMGAEIRLEDDSHVYSSERAQWAVCGMAMELGMLRERDAMEVEHWGTCVYCCENSPRFSIEEQADAWFIEHDRTCLQHPMRGLEARIDEMKTEMDATRQERDEARQEAGRWKLAAESYHEAALGQQERFTERAQGVLLGLEQRVNSAHGDALNLLKNIVLEQDRALSKAQARILRLEVELVGK